MARGDFVKIKVRTPAGVDETTVTAEAVGSYVDVAMPVRGEGFVTVEQRNQKHEPTLSARFLAVETLSIVEGHEKLARKAAKK